MKVLNLKDGSIEITNNIEDIKNLVREKLGEDIFYAMEDLTDNKVYETLRFDSDMLHYESQLEANRKAIEDIQEHIQDMSNHIGNAKRIDRDNIRQILVQIQKQIDNVI